MSLINNNIGISSTAAAIVAPTSVEPLLPIDVRQVFEDGKNNGFLDDCLDLSYK